MRQTGPIGGKAGSRLARCCGGALALALVLLATRAEAQTVDLPGSHPLEATMLMTRAAPDRPLRLRIGLALRNRPELERLLADQLDPSSPRYHQWLKPGEFDVRFGRTTSEVAAVERWVRGQGMQVLAASPREVIVSATVVQAEAAFTTRIETSADGAVYANRTDPRIPASLARIVGYIGGLDNTTHWAPVGLPKAHASSDFAELQRLALGGELSAPQYDGPVGDGFGPSDLYTFYDESALLSGGTNGGGASGDCIAVVEDSDYLEAAPTLFVSDFSLATLNLTRVLPDGSSPGRTSDENETLLDIEWAHAAAPGAPITAYIGDGSTSLYDAINAAVTDDTCGSISISFGYCGASSSFYTNSLDPLFVKAAGQGQTVFVSSGDEGAAGLVLNSAGDECVTGTSRNVNEMSADTNVSSVGGTSFTPNYNSHGADVGDVAESVWNDGGGASGGGASQVFTKPSYQVGVTPSDGQRDVPDVAFSASPESPGFYWVTDDDSTAELTCCIGGTSLAAPLWAGLSKLIAQTEGGRIGSMNQRIYQLGELASTAQSGIRDVTSGNNDFNGVTGFAAQSGYNQATGWGTADMGVFVGAFVSSTPTPTASPSPTASSTATATASVSPTPTISATPTVSATPTESATATPTVTPTAAVAAELSVSARTIHFPSAIVLGSNGVASLTRTITISNPKTRRQDASVNISGLSPSPSALFSVVSQTCIGILQPGAKCTVSLTYTPNAPGSQSGALTILNDATNPALQIALDGKGKQGKLGFTSKQIDFGNLPVGSTSAMKTITLSNENPVAMSLGALTLADPSFTLSTSCGTTLAAAGGTCEIGVTFKAQSAGTHEATISVSDDAAGSPQTLRLTGRGM